MTDTNSPKHSDYKLSLTRPAVPRQERSVSVETLIQRVLGPLSWISHILRFMPYIGFGKVLRFEDDLYRMDKGTDVLEWWAQELELGVEVEGLEHLPEDGPVILFCNHPTGLTDGIALWHGLKHKRPDMRVMMNAQGLDIIPAFHELLVPVRFGADNTIAGRKGMWQRLQGAVDRGQVTMMFPAGRLSQLDWFGDWDVHELPWQRGIVKIAKDFPQATMLPVFIEGRVRKHFYVLHRLFPFLRDVLLYTELHSKRHWPYRLKILPPAQVTSAKQAQELVESQKTKKWFQLPRHKRYLKK